MKLASLPNPGPTMFQVLAWCEQRQKWALTMLAKTYESAAAKAHHLREHGTWVQIVPW